MKRLPLLMEALIDGLEGKERIMLMGVGIPFVDNGDVRFPFSLRGLNAIEFFVQSSSVSRRNDAC